MRIGIVGKPNVGKSTFFAAATLANVDIANYPFCTIEPNVGVAFLPAPNPCPCGELRSNRELEGRLDSVSEDDVRKGSLCTPNTGTCVGHLRLVPTFLVDVAGLVPGAHEGKGRGNAFLADLASCDALIQVIDAAGTTDEEGVPIGKNNDSEAVTKSILSEYNFLTGELDAWIAGIIEDGWARGVRKVQSGGGGAMSDYLHEKLTGLGATLAKVSNALDSFRGEEIDFEAPASWDIDARRNLANCLRKEMFPIHVAANKAEIAPGKTWVALEKILAENNSILIPCFSDGELALRRAAKAGLISYTPGSPTFEISPNSQLNDAQKAGLKGLHDSMSELGGTGVAKLISGVLYDALEHIVVYPVQDESKWVDGDGKVLPDALVVPDQITAKDLAYAVHSDLGDGFIKAIDGKSKRVIGADHQLSDSDVVKIHAKN